MKECPKIRPDGKKCIRIRAPGNEFCRQHSTMEGKKKHDNWRREQVTDTKLQAAVDSLDRHHNK